MKCICGIAKDHPCPETCTPEIRLARRNAVIVDLFNEGKYTQQEIAGQVGVSRQTIQIVTANLPMVGKLKHAQSPRNPRGAGRPKGAGKAPKPKPPKRNPGEEQRQASINVRPEVWEEFKTQAEQEGKSAAAKLGEMIIGRVPEIGRVDLAPTAQQKFDAAIRQEKKRMERDFESRVLEECKRRLDELSLPAYVEEMAKIERSITSRKGIMDRTTFRLIWSCLHVDSRLSASDDKLNAAFHAFEAVEKRLLNEKDSPTEFRPIPKTWAEMAAMREKVRATNSARSKRAADARKNMVQR